MIRRSTPYDHCPAHLDINQWLHKSPRYAPEDCWDNRSSNYIHAGNFPKQVRASNDWRLQKTNIGNSVHHLLWRIPQSIYFGGKSGFILKANHSYQSYGPQPERTETKRVISIIECTCMCMHLFVYWCLGNQSATHTAEQSKHWSAWLALKMFLPKSRRISTFAQLFPNSEVNTQTHSHSQSTHSQPVKPWKSYASLCVSVINISLQLIFQSKV